MTLELPYAGELVLAGFRVDHAWLQSGISLDSAGKPFPPISGIDVGKMNLRGRQKYAAMVQRRLRLISEKIS